MHVTCNALIETSESNLITFCMLLVMLYSLHQKGNLIVTCNALLFLVFT